MFFIVGCQKYALAPSSVDQSEPVAETPMNIKQFEKAMKDRRYNFEVIDVEQDFIPTTRKRIILDNGVIDMYLFGSENEMEEESKYIDSGGCSYNNGSKSVEVSGISFPHFYKKGSLIVQYIGEDEKIMSDLRDILGEQFAGYTGESNRQDINLPTIEQIVNTLCSYEFEGRRSFSKGNEKAG